MSRDLERFVSAQAENYADALAELRAGAKHSHWMWYVFPQVAGLGHSAMAVRYAIATLDEARAYLAHPVLGRRYAECLDALAALPAALSAETVFGGIDAVKLRSSLTLFEAAGLAAAGAAIDRWHGGTRDPATLGRLGIG